MGQLFGAFRRAARWTARRRFAGTRWLSVQTTGAFIWYLWIKAKRFGLTKLGGPWAVRRRWRMGELWLGRMMGWCIVLGEGRTGIDTKRHQFCRRWRQEDLTQENEDLKKNL